MIRKNTEAPRQWLILGNGLTGRLLTRIPVPPSVGVISQNRVYPYGPNHAVVVSRPEYLDLLPQDIDPASVYVPESWDPSLQYNRIDAPANSTHMAMQLVCSWGYRVACALGWDSHALGDPDPSVGYQGARAAHRSRGFAQGTDRWRNEYITARRHTNVIVIPISTPAELERWFSLSLNNC